MAYASQTFFKSSLIGECELDLIQTRQTVAKNKQGVVVCACNLSCVGREGKMIIVWGWYRQKAKLYVKNKQKQKGLGGWIK
jgi:hypothetical protein